jgi:hypothetical protein
MDVAIVIRRERAAAPIGDGAAIIPIETVEREGAAIGVLDVGHAFTERQIVRASPLAALTLCAGDGDGGGIGAARIVIPHDFDAA